MTNRSPSRRTVLRGIGAGSVGLVAGCAGDGGGDGGDGGDGGSGDGGGGDGGATTTPSSSSINIGAVAPLSGTYANSGRDERQGMQLAIDERNAEGGVNDEEVGLVIRDSEADSSTAVQQARNIYSNNEIQAMSGVMSSSVSQAMTGLSSELEVPFLAVGSATTLVTGEECAPYYFRHYQNSHMNAMGHAQWAAENLGLNWAQISSDYAWGHDIRDIQQNVNEENGGTIVTSELVPFGATDFSSALNTVRAQADQIDVLFFNLFGNDAVNGFTQAVDLGLKDQMDLFVAQQTVSQASATGPQAAAGTYAGLKYWPTLESGTNQDFVDRYVEAYDSPPSSQSWSGYICAREIMDAWERTGSFDADDIVSALEGHEYDNILGDNASWRACDHQAAEPVFVSEGTGETIYDGVADFEILEKKSADEIMRDCSATGCSL